MERLVVQASGLDPTGVAVPEVGHGRESGAAYLGALAAYAGGTPEGVALWLTHCGEAIVAGARRGPGSPTRCGPAGWAERAGVRRAASDPPTSVGRPGCPESQDFRLAPDASTHGTTTTGESPTTTVRHHRGPTRGQSTGGPIVVGSSHCDKTRIHAWYPGRLTVRMAPRSRGAIHLWGVPPILVRAFTGASFAICAPGGVRDEISTLPSEVERASAPAPPPPELGALTAPVVPPTGAVPFPGAGRLPGQAPVPVQAAARRGPQGRRARSRRPQVRGRPLSRDRARPPTVEPWTTDAWSGWRAARAAWARRCWWRRWACAR